MGWHALREIIQEYERERHLYRADYRAGDGVSYQDRADEDGDVRKRVEEPLAGTVQLAAVDEGERVRDRARAQHRAERSAALETGDPSESRQDAQSWTQASGAEMIARLDPAAGEVRGEEEQQAPDMAKIEPVHEETPFKTPFEQLHERLSRENSRRKKVLWRA